MFCNKPFLHLWRGFALLCVNGCVHRYTCCPNQPLSSPHRVHLTEGEVEAYPTQLLTIRASRGSSLFTLDLCACTPCPLLSHLSAGHKPKGTGMVSSFRHDYSECTDRTKRVKLNADLQGKSPLSGSKLKPVQF